MLVLDDPDQAGVAGQAPGRFGGDGRAVLDLAAARRRFLQGLLIDMDDDLLALWRSLGKTVVFVTHSVFESVYLSQRIVVMTPRPGCVSTEVAIDAPYPRDQRFRTSADYAAWCRRVSEALASAAAEGA